jgi:hypothetical protein
VVTVKKEGWHLVIEGQALSSPLGCDRKVVNHNNVYHVWRKAFASQYPLQYDTSGRAFN